MSNGAPALVIGGGFFGCELAVRLARHFDRVELVEAAPRLLERASYHNQARVHAGYHYPRSLLTALRSRVNYSRFKADYAGCIDDRFTKYYAIARRFSKVTSGQFAAFCNRIGARCRPVPGLSRGLFDGEFVEGAFLVDECAFDADGLRSIVTRKLAESGVRVHLNSTVESLKPIGARRVRVRAQSANGGNEVEAAAVFVCAYSAINVLLAMSALPALPLRHELTEIALVEPPPELRSAGITVMCGPFFSCMPFPPRGLHSLSHVRYTPHCELADGIRPERLPQSNFPHMLRDAVRFVPCLYRARYVDSLWEVKTVLKQSESNDSRPILFLEDHGMPNLHCVLGSKIDNIYDALDYLEQWIHTRRAA